MGVDAGYIAHIDLAIAGHFGTFQRIFVSEQGGVADVRVNLSSVAHIHFTITGSITDEMKLDIQLGSTVLGNGNGTPTEGVADLGGGPVVGAGRDEKFLVQIITSQIFRTLNEGILQQKCNENVITQIAGHTDADR